MIDLRRKTCFSVTRILFLIILVISFSSCRSVKSTAELENHFTKKQIKDLNKLTSYFKNEILKSNDFEKSFKNLIETIHFKGIDTSLNNVSFEKQKILYSSISKSTFNEIWEIRIITQERFEGEEYILPKYKGKFQLYLKQLGDTNPFASDSFNHMEKSGDFNMFFFNSYISSNFHKMDFNNFNNQLIISIYYLSIIDRRERDPKAKKRRLELQKKVKFQLQ